MVMQKNILAKDFLFIFGFLVFLGVWFLLLTNIRKFSVFCMCGFKVNVNNIT